MLLTSQVTMADNQTVDRCRAHCAAAGVHYLRLCPPLQVDVALDETQVGQHLEAIHHIKSYQIPYKKL